MVSTQKRYEALQGKWQRTLTDRIYFYVEQYGVRPTALQIRILSAMYANSEIHGRIFTDFERNQMCHMLYRDQK